MCSEICPQEINDCNGNASSVIAMVNKRTPAMRYGSLSAQGWLSFSEIAMWGINPEGCGYR